MKTISPLTQSEKTAVEEPVSSDSPFSNTTWLRIYLSFYWEEIADVSQKNQISQFLSLHVPLCKQKIMFLSVSRRPEFDFLFSSAIGGAAIVYAITPSQSIGSLGVTAPANDVTTSQAFVVELVLTFILVFVIFAATDPSRGMTGYGVPLAIGICVFICLMHGVSNKHYNICREDFLFRMKVKTIESSQSLQFCCTII